MHFSQCYSDVCVLINLPFGCSESSSPMLAAGERQETIRSEHDKFVTLAQLRAHRITDEGEIERDVRMVLYRLNGICAA